VVAVFEKQLHSTNKKRRTPGRKENRGNRQDLRSFEGSKGDKCGFAVGRVSWTRGPGVLAMREDLEKVRGKSAKKVTREAPT